MTVKPWYARLLVFRRYWVLTMTVRLLEEGCSSECPGSAADKSGTIAPGNKNSRMSGFRVNFPLRERI